VAGAQIDGKFGPVNPRAAHLIKVACEVICGRRDYLEVLGTDYPTKDGTGVRDYIHVEDLAAAHVDALRYLEAGGASQILNVGYGKGASVREVISVMEEASGVKIRVVEKPRRPGDAAAVIADPAKIKRILAWKPRHADLKTICESALDWETRLLGIKRAA
jgi:UDP-glucose 4-epimerase